MYHQNPIVTFKESDFVHTDGMYSVSPIHPLEWFETPTRPANELDSFLVNTVGARSELGQLLEMKKRHSQNQKPDHEKLEQKDCKPVSNTEPVNEMHLDKYIVRRTAPVSKLGKRLLNTNCSENCNPVLLHRLRELERTIDAYLIPMSLNMSSGFVAPAQKTEIATIKSQIELIEGQMSGSISIFTPEVPLPHATSQDLIDLAVHCDPRKPPLALLTYSRMLLISGRNVSVQFYRHSSLTLFPEYLIPLEHFFTGKPRSSGSDFILSIIWRPCSFGCMAVGNPFRDLPLFGESIVLMSIARLSANFTSCFGNLLMVESAVSSGEEKTLVECIKKVAREDAEQFSPEEVLLFFSAANMGLSSVFLKSAKPWFDRCMRNDCITGALKIMDLCC